MPKILVAYGYHRGEPYSRDVGVLFSQINPFYPDVVVKKFPRSYLPGVRKGRADMEASKQVRQSRNELTQTNQADILIDLHDDLPALKSYPHVPREYAKVIPRFEPSFLYFDYGKSKEEHMMKRREVRIKAKEFNAIWNKQNKNKSEIMSLTYYKNEREEFRFPCVALEFHNVDGKVSVEEGSRYVGMLAHYLLSKF